MNEGKINRTHTTVGSILISFTTLLCAIGCSQKSEPRYPLIPFEVKQSLLGEKITDDEGTLIFSSPRGWDRIENEELQAIFTRLKSTYEMPNPYYFNNDMNPLCGFYDPSGMSALVVSRRSKFDAADTMGALLNLKLAMLKVLPDAEVDGSLFSTRSGVTVFTGRASNSETICYKLIYVDGKKSALQFDVCISQDRYPELREMLESVFGSVTLH